MPKLLSQERSCNDKSVYCSGLSANGGSVSTEPKWAIFNRHFTRKYMETLTWQQFDQIDMRTGTIIRAWAAEGVHVPAYRMEIDFGPLGIKKSSAQLTKRYTPEQLAGKKVVAVVNFPPKQIGKFISECLVLGGVDEEGDVALLTTEPDVPNGWRIA